VGADVVDSVLEAMVLEAMVLEAMVLEAMVVTAGSRVVVGMAVVVAVGASWKSTICSAFAKFSDT